MSILINQNVCKIIHYGLGMHEGRIAFFYKNYEISIDKSVEMMYILY